jgi:hypothetical protein
MAFSVLGQIWAYERRGQPGPIQKRCQFDTVYFGIVWIVLSAARRGARSEDGWRLRVLAIMRPLLLVLCRETLTNTTKRRPDFARPWLRPVRAISNEMTWGGCVQTSLLPLDGPSGAAPLPLDLSLPTATGRLQRRPTYGPHGLATEHGLLIVWSAARGFSLCLTEDDRADEGRVQHACVPAVVP